MRSKLIALVAGSAAVLLLPLTAQGVNGHANYHAVCPGPPSGHAHCHVLVVTDAHGNPNAGTAPTGLSPATIASAYDFPTSTSAGAGTTIAIVDAYDDPTAESDLATFSGQYGLPSCTTANGCFRKVNQNGGTSYPRADSGWALEISLDVQWAHAIAPGAKILLVEASSNSFANLMAAEDYAAANADYVSNSWGGSEFSGESTYDSHFRRSGVSFFVSAGDAGLPAEYPSASPNVISVGGTTLHFSGGSVSSETGWKDGGGGCSSYESATSAQSGFPGYGQAGCGGRRATPDVSLDADPASGVSVYDSTSYSGKSGWFTVGGTSASSPMWAARAAVTGDVVDAGYVYGTSIAFRDITSGNNGARCLVGFDLCTGRGSWTGGSSGQPPSQPAISFTSAATTLQAGEAVQMSLTVSSGAATVTLASSSPGGTFSSDGKAYSAGMALEVGGSAAGTFWYRDTRAGTPTLTASENGYTSGTQTETVTAAPLASIAVSPKSASLTVGDAATFTATGADAFGNAVGLSSTTWTTGAPGTLSNASDRSATFTATGLGSGPVTATVGSTSGQASVTVTASTAPTAPTGLTASVRGKHIALSWQGSGSNVTYNVYRGIASEGEGFLAGGLTGTSYNDTSAASATEYFYYVTAVGPDGTETAPSLEAHATTR
jgi:hypothetical protein